MQAGQSTFVTLHYRSMHGDLYALIVIDTSTLDHSATLLDMNSRMVLTTKVYHSWTIDLCSLVPRPYPAFQCFTLKNAGSGLGTRLRFMHFGLINGARSCSSIFTGQQFDKDGIFRQWWNTSSIEEFRERQTCFVDQYNNFTFEGFPVVT